MIIGFDLDDTITNTTNYIYRMFLEWHEEIAGLGKYTGTYCPQNYDCRERFTKITPKQANDFLSWYFEFSNLESPLEPGIREIFQALHERGHQICIVTARSTINDKVQGVASYNGLRTRSDTLQYLEKNRLLVDKVYFNGSNKLEIMRKHGISCLVDDAIHNIIPVSKEYTAFIKDRLWNHFYQNKEVFRIMKYDDTFLEQIDLLERRLKNGNTSSNVV